MIARQPHPGIPNVFTAEYRQHLREISRPAPAAGIALLTLLLHVKEAYEAYVGPWDFVSWVAALCEVTAYVSLFISLISMGLTDYSDAVEQLP